MKPVICFYEDNQVIFSQNYKLQLCPDNQNVNQFLDAINSKYFDQLKVVQINFETTAENLSISKKRLYSGAKAAVFILDSYKLLTAENLNVAMNSIESMSLRSFDSVKIKFQSLVTKNEFTEKVGYIKKQISSGRIYQANLTAPLKATFAGDGLNLFAWLKEEFKGQYQAYLPISDYEIISFSPELFLKKENNLLTTQPIKGSSIATEDFQNGLLKDKKEEAELSMIVDLLRNDLNSLSTIHSATVIKHREKMQLGYIQHTYSEIAVHNEDPLSFIISKMMPGGSISGCPKLESLHVIGECENYQRQAYTGAIGWWQGHDFTLNITIRSFIKHQAEVYYHAGCGIVYDSDPENEWNEFLLKTGKLNVTQ